MTDINKLLSYGDTYFKSVEELTKLLGETQAAYDAAECYIYIQNCNTSLNIDPKRDTLTDWLVLPPQKVDRAIKFLRVKNLINNRGQKGYHIITESDLSYKAFGIASQLRDWYKSSLRYDFVRFLHTVTYKTNCATDMRSRRQLARCFCCTTKGCKSWFCVVRNIKKDIADFKDSLITYMEQDDYIEKLWEKRNIKIERGKNLKEFNESRKFIHKLDEHPTWWNKHQPNNILTSTWNIIKELRTIGYRGKQLEQQLFKNIVGNTTLILQTINNNIRTAEYMQGNYRVVERITRGA